MNIKKKIFYYLISVYLFIALGLFLYFNFHIIKNYSDYEIKNSIKQSEQLTGNFEIPFQAIINIQALLENNQELIDFMKQKEPISIDQKNHIESFLKYASSFNNIIKGIYLLDTKGDFCTSDWQVNETLFKDYFSSTNESIMEEANYSSIHNSNNYQIFSTVSVITYIIPIFDKVNIKNKEKIGTIFIDINYDMLSEIFIKNAILSNEKILIAYPNGELLYKYPYQTDFSNLLENNEQLVKGFDNKFYTKIFGEDSLIISNDLSYQKLKLIQIINTNQIHLLSNRIKKFTIFFFIIIIVVGAIIATVISSLITKPIIKLNKTMKLVDQGNLDVSINNKRNDEIGELINSFNSMVLKLDDSFKNSIASEKRKTELEFRILQEQINPHFLYNTLDSIKWLAVIQNVENISEMATSLITLLKYNSQRSQLQVSLMQELSALKAYIRIQKNRYGNTIKVIYNISSNTTDCKIIKFILQPIVENSILHAFEGYEDNNIITVSSRIENKALLLTIEDNGIGFDNSKINIEENEKLKNALPFHKGIGISNTNERIRLYYGDKYGIFVNSKLGVGTKISIVLPCIIEDNIIL